ncbi:MAG TPA: hypothetical protein VK430_02590 [Xanthobacteraceae bacterium]|nr:hypothetical protein [Xanthobacteraceae bacterium]
MRVAIKSGGVARLRVRAAAVFAACADRRSRHGLIAAAAASALLPVLAGPAFAGCKPSRPKPPVILKDMGPCAFDRQSLSYRGEPVEQAMCLMRGMDSTRNLAPMLQGLPPPLAARIGRDGELPAREALSAFLSKQDLEWDFAAYLWRPVSHANDNDPDAPSARYFVVHDTSGPNFGRRPFPADLDANAKLNNLNNFKCVDGWGRAHVVVNRSGAMLLSHDFAIPWRETKFERAVNFAGALKGLFLHVEMIQPRRSAGGRGRRNDMLTPNPAFTTAQYDRLALLYVIASVRAEHWLVPAFHAAIDAGIRSGHDDPLNFNIESFADSLQRLLDRLASGAESAEPPAGAEQTPAPPAGADATTGPNSSAMSSPKAAAASDSRRPLPW